MRWTHYLMFALAALVVGVIFVVLDHKGKGAVISRLGPLGDWALGVPTSVGTTAAAGTVTPAPPGTPMAG